MNAVNKNNEMPLQIIKSSNAPFKEDIIQYLLSKGASETWKSK